MQGVRYEGDQNKRTFVLLEYLMHLECNRAFHGCIMWSGVSVMRLTLHESDVGACIGNTIVIIGCASVSVFLIYLRTVVSGCLLKQYQKQSFDAHDYDTIQCPRPPRWHAHSPPVCLLMYFHPPIMFLFISNGVSRAYQSAHGVHSADQSAHGIHSADQLESSTFKIKCEIYNL